MRYHTLPCGRDVSSQGPVVSVTHRSHITIHGPAGPLVERSMLYVSAPAVPRQLMPLLLTKLMRGIPAGVASGAEVFCIAKACCRSMLTRVRISAVSPG